ncbi:hypothetical protein B6I21_09110, partial [candidate division KSB1 bacterium 4572_119]
NHHRLIPKPIRCPPPTKTARACRRQPLAHSVFRDSVHLRYEAKEKLSARRPFNLGQASRLGGITPGDVTVLHKSKQSSFKFHRLGIFLLLTLAKPAK